MARSTPLIVKPVGTIGDAVFTPRGNVRSHEVHQPGMTFAYRCAFANLSKQWATSAVEYKELCRCVRKRGSGSAGLMKQANYLALYGWPYGTVTRDTPILLLPDFEQLTTRAYQWEVNLLVHRATVRWYLSKVQLVWKILGIPSNYVNRRFFYQLMRGQTSVAGHGPENLYPPWEGVRAVAYPLRNSSDIYQHFDARVLLPQYPGNRVLSFCMAIADNSTNGKKVVYGNWVSAANG